MTLERSGKKEFLEMLVEGNVEARFIASDFLCLDFDLSCLGHRKKTFKKTSKRFWRIKKGYYFCHTFRRKNCGGKGREKETSSLKILRR